MLSAILCLALQCGGCEPLTISLDYESEPGPHSEAMATSAVSWVKVEVDAFRAGVCGPDIGTTCSKQYAEALFTTELSAWSGPSEIVVAQFTGGPVIVMPAGPYFETGAIVSSDCHLDGDRARIAIFDASTFLLIDQTACPYWGSPCAKPD